MRSFIIEGCPKLEGEVAISGSKNSALPILASTVSVGGKYIIKNVPYIEDVKKTIEILNLLGCKATYEEGNCYIDTNELNTHEISSELAKKLRSSIIFLGPMLRRNKVAKLAYPGGCDIGARPIDLHLKGLKKLGVRVEEERDHVFCTAENVKNTSIVLDYPSVGATENIMLFATGVSGKTKIYNCAKEPEIKDIEKFLNKCGFDVSGAGTNIITVRGNKDKKIDDVIEYQILPDRIETGTFLALCAAKNSNVLLKNTYEEHLREIIEIYKQCGCNIYSKKDCINIVSSGKIEFNGNIFTKPFPGFPTDMQAQVMASLAVAKGMSTIEETVFENRFKHVEELNKMGANITVNDRLATIIGVKELHGNIVEAKDLRGGAALIIAAIVAQGKSEIKNIYHVDRGYENLDLKLSNLGANIKIQ